MTMDRHEPFEELISASFAGDLTESERDRLDTHLDRCGQCRATLAAFADQRRIMSGLRHVAPPRDLGARVRTGIERGRFAPTPWWRRPAVMFAGIGGGLAAVAGALLGIVLLNAVPAEPEVGQASPTASIAAIAPTARIEPSETPLPTLPPIPTPTSTADASPAQTASVQPSITPAPTPNPVVEVPEPDVVMAVTGPVEDLAFNVVDGTTGDETPIEDPVGDDAEDPVGPSGPPIAAELSPDGQWLAFMTEIGQRGVNDVWATRITDAPEPADPEATPAPASTVEVGETVHLGESVAGSPFLERMSWSSDGRYLAFTLADPETDEPDADAWIFQTRDGRALPLTDTGNAYAASFIPSIDDTTANVWVSVAGDEPRSFVMGLRTDSEITPGDPAELGTGAADVFQPLLSPNGSLAIFWRGRMSAERDSGWVFVENGAPYLAAHDVDGGTHAFSSERTTFSGLAAEGSGFRSAAITWGPDGDAYAVWDTIWNGDAAEGQDPYPDPTRVYFGHATDDRGLTPTHAIDRADVDPELMIVDVEVAPTGDHLLITVRQASGGVMEAPRAELRLVTRNVGDVPDEVELLEVAENGWVGPAVFRTSSPLDWDSSLAP